MIANKPKLNLFDFTMIMVSSVIGMGIFRTPVNVAAASPTEFIFFAVWVVGGLIALCGALTYAEIGSRFPVTGGYYKIFSYAYHPSIAFGVNCIILISNAAGLAGVSLIGAEYITKVLWPHSSNLSLIQAIISVSSIILFYGVNLLGLKMSARTQNVLTIVKIGMILLMIAPLFFMDAQTSSQISSAFPPPGEIEGAFSTLDYIKAFGIGLIAVSFTYSGYPQTINFGEEVKNPSKNMPKGIFTGILLIIFLYLAINYAYVKIIGFENLKHETGIAAIMITRVFGPAGGNIVAFLLFLSVLAYVNVQLLSNPRVMQAMSEEGVLPKTFGKRTVNNNVLFTSLSVFAALCALIVFWAKDFDEILSFSIFLDCFGMVLSGAAIFVLRKRTRHLDNTGIYKMKLYPLMPVTFIAAYIFVAISVFMESPKTAMIGLAILAAFIALYFIVKKFGEKEKPNL